MEFFKFNASKIHADKIERPIQLLACLIIGLIFIDSVFLYTATQNKELYMTHLVLVLFSVINVFVFLYVFYELLTNHRPNLLNDESYCNFVGLNSKELEKNKASVKEEEELIIQNLVDLASKDGNSDKEYLKNSIQKMLRDNKALVLSKKYNNFWYLSLLQGNQFFVELNEDRVKITTPKRIVHISKPDLDYLIVDDVLEGNLNEPGSIKLSTIGEEVAKLVEESNKDLLKNLGIFNSRQ